MYLQKHTTKRGYLSEEASVHREMLVARWNLVECFQPAPQSKVVHDTGAGRGGTSSELA